MAKKSKEFGDMLSEALHTIKMCEKKKIAIIEDEIGYELGYKGGSAVERWRRGYLPPTVKKREKLTCIIFERTCGNLERAWFKTFLCHAQHLYPERILEELFPEPSPIPVPFLAPPLPEQTLIGRDQLLRKLREGLFAGHNLALFALNGLPGVGKSALAITLAHDKDVRAHFPDGVLWAGLGREPDVPALLNVWGIALGIPASEMAKLATIEERAGAIKRAIGTDKLLLVIDDAWEIEAVRAFKLGGPNCAHILTTRSPDFARYFAGQGARSVEELNESDSLALLAEFVPDVIIRQPEKARALVKAVGGLPLALILIARYIRKAVELGQEHVLSDVLIQLEHTSARFGLTIAQSPLEKQPSLPFGIPLSLLASIEISDKALDEPARQLLRTLSLFPPKPNSFSQEAALSVADAAEKSLNPLTEAGLLERSGTTRYTLHQTIADYANLESTTVTTAKKSVKEQEIIYQRGARYFADFAQQHKNSDGYPSLDLDWQNVSHFLQWAYENQQWAPLIEGVQGLTHINLGVVGFMDARGHWHKVHDLLSQAREGARALDDAHLEACILTKQGAFAFRQSNFDAARHYLEQSLSHLSTLPSTKDVTLQRTHLYEFMSRLEMQHNLESASEWIEQGLTELDALPLKTEAIRHQKGYFYVLLSTLHGRMGRFGEAIAVGEKGLELLPREPTAARVSGLTTLAIVFSMQGMLDKGTEYLKVGIELAEKLGDLRRLADLWTNMGVNEKKRSHFSAAIQAYQTALQLYQNMAEEYGQGRVCSNLGEIYLIVGEDELAFTHLTTAIGIAQARQVTRLEAFAQSNLASLQIKRGELNEAKAALSRAHEICLESHLSNLLPEVLCRQAENARLTGELEQGLKQIESALQLCREKGYLSEEGMACSIKGKILDAMSRFDEAEEAHQMSLQLLAQQEPYELATSQLAFAQHYMMRDGHLSERPNSLLMEALATFKALGAKREIALIKSLLE